MIGFGSFGTDPKGAPTGRLEYQHADFVKRERALILGYPCIKLSLSISTPPGNVLSIQFHVWYLDTTGNGDQSVRQMLSRQMGNDFSSHGEC